MYFDVDSVQCVYVDLSASGYDGIFEYPVFHHIQMVLLPGKPGEKTWYCGMYAPYPSFWQLQLPAQTEASGKKNK